MSRLPRALLVLTVACLGAASPRAAHAAASLSLYGTFQSMGVIVEMAPGDDPDRDAAARVDYRPVSGGAFQTGFPLTRVADVRFVGSLFWLAPGTGYEVRVTLSDPDHGPLDGAVLTLAGSTRAELSVPPATASYFVGPSGFGTTCSFAAPCTLAEGLRQVRAGEEVVLRGGIYYGGNYAMTRSGTAGQPIVIRGLSGESAILDGTDPASFTWTARGGGVYQTRLNVIQPTVVANGARLYPYRSLADLQMLRYGLPGFYASGLDLYVRLAGDANPASAAMAISREPQAFNFGQDHVYYLNLTFRNYGQSEFPRAIYLDGSRFNVISGCTFALDDVGVAFKRAAGENVVQDSEFYDTTAQWDWDAFKASGLSEAVATLFYDPVTGRGNVIRRNLVHDSFDGLGVAPSDTAGLTNETDVYDNVVYDMGDDGLEVDGRSSNVRIWGNTFRRVLVGVSLAPAYTGPTYVLRNLIHTTDTGVNPFPSTPIKFNSGFGESGPMYLFHNTVSTNTPGQDALHIENPGSWVVIQSRNNIWSGTNHALKQANAPIASRLDLDWDDLFTSGPGALSRWDNLGELATLATLQAQTGQELHGFNVAPSFRNPAAGDYTLGPGSALLDRGLVIPGINDGYLGTAPDLGAFESAGTPLPEPHPLDRYRLYSNVTKEHHFTTDRNEYLVLGSQGWIQEGIAHRVLDGPGDFEGMPTLPLYRLYHPLILQHLWTTDANENAQLGVLGWIQEGVDGYVLAGPIPGRSTPLYRLAYAFQPLHLWTTDRNEYDTLPRFGWLQEGISAHVLP